MPLITKTIAEIHVDSNLQTIKINEREMRPGSHASIQNAGLEDLAGHQVGIHVRRRPAILEVTLLLDFR